MSNAKNDTPCPPSARGFSVEAGNQDPASRQHHGRNEPIHQERHASRAVTNLAARRLLHQGLWVEVYDENTKGLLAGPFDPDHAAPEYIV